METAQTDELLEKANRLYWNSDLTVDQIVEDLGIGRNTLYSGLRPVPAGANCAECGERMVFTNRTNRSQNVGTCLSCGAEGPARRAEPVDRAAEPGGAGAASGVAAGDARAESGGGTEPGVFHESWESWRAELRYLDTTRLLVFGGAAVLGVAAGVAAARTWRS